jgi:UDP-2,3-diacylglucosamine pyrophosphatase LpxH
MLRTELRKKVQIIQRDIKAINLVTTPDSRFVVFSDAHRGDGTGADDFAANSLIFKCALDYYLAEGFTLIELGDAEELWEVKRFDQIYITHTSIYERLAAFHDGDPQKTRYIKIWGNHDLYWQDNEAALHRLFPGINVYEAALLDGRILLWHGHQADPSCSGVWARIAKFFVGKCWTTMQRWGFRDPTRAANNPGRCDEIDETLHEWASGGLPLDSRLRGNDREKGGNDRGGDGKIDTIIAGHTHRPVYENLSLTERMYLEGRMGNMGGRRAQISSDRAYYNTGSCVHPRCITGIEITPGKEGRPAFTLIKWGYATQGAGRTLAIERQVLGENKC